ncbi:MAG: hemolysin family protein [Tissierellia bacterium]|nr:hemolysin family protein [Tissierellia bacterium]
MDPDPWIRISIFYLAGCMAAFLLRILYTAVRITDNDQLSPNVVKIIEKRESVLTRLSLSYNLLKTLFFAIITLELSMAVGLPPVTPWMGFGAVVLFLVMLLVFDLLTVELADRLVGIHPEKVLATLRGFLTVILFFSHPIAKGYLVIKMALIKLFKLPPVTPKVTLDQIIMMVQRGEKQGIINPVEKDMIDSVMGFNDMVAEEIMTPRTEVFMIDGESAPEDFMEDLMVDRYSRIPVYEEYIDNIIGVLYLKDFFSEAWKVGFSNVDVRKILRPAYFVPERKNIHTLFQEMQRAHRHMAILMDEYGGFSGIVTMEDLIEEIMGDIDDEFDADEPECYELTTNSAVVQGSTAIKDINDMLHISIPEDTDDYDTIAGFIINQLGFIPEDHKIGTIYYDNLRIRVLEVEDRRIKKVKIVTTKTNS